MKRTMDIEAVLRWAYREELPKAVDTGRDRPASVRPGWDAVESYAQLLTIIDCNRYGVLPNLAEPGAPHPDAIAVWQAVRDLDGFEIVVPDDWAPMADIGALDGEAPALAQQALARATVMDAAGRRRLKGQSRLVEKHALLGGCPAWEMDVPEKKVVRQAKTGQPAWFLDRIIYDEILDGGYVERTVTVDGFNQTRRRPYPGAYQRTYLDPDPVPALVGRIEYEVWHAALGVLVNELDGALETVVVTAADRPLRPWDGEARAARRLLPSLAKPVIPALSTSTRARRENKTRCAA
jgi:hypothetical protein